MKIKYLLQGIVEPHLLQGIVEPHPLVILLVLQLHGDMRQKLKVA